MVDSSDRFDLSVGDNCHIERWGQLEQLARNKHGPWVVLGDFNVIRFSHEKMFSDHVTISAMDEFHCCLDSIGLSFLYFKHLQRAQKHLATRSVPVWLANVVSVKKKNRDD